ncbi:hypothetical protein [Streptomyces vastus]|uniref:hypothetical protein n=1 Tax=Streptomyces vastus TaxID=285451 RepID=UPI0031D7B235
MPQVSITLAEGRTPEQIRDLMHEVHAAVLRAVLHFPGDNPRTPSRRAGQLV